MIISELFEGPQLCPECGGISFSDLILAEKKDACYHKVKASAKVWPSAYASGRLVQCRKKGAANYGNKSEGVAESIDPDQQGRLNELIDDYNLSMKERSYWEADSILDKITREFGKDIADQVDQQGVAEGSEPDAYGRTGEKHECGSCDGTGIDTHDDECSECGGKGWVRDKESLKKQGVAEGMSDDMAAMAQKKFPNAYISKDGEEVQKPKNWGKRYTPPAAPPADLEKQRRELTAKYPNIDELVRRAELNRDPDYEMADGQAYYAARDAEQNYQKLRQIQRVIQGLNESLNRSHLP
jgi:hypothetical protein